MTDLLQTIREFVQLFDDLSIKYAIMGGWAVRAHGLPRPTYDVDFTIACDRTNLPELYRTAIDRGFSVPEQYQRGWIDFVADMPLVKFRLYLQEKGIDIDIFLAESEFQAELLARRQEHLLDGMKVWFVSPEDLILLKLIAARPRDIGDIYDVLLMQGELDKPYLRNWARLLGVAEKLEEVLEDAP